MKHNFLGAVLGGAIMLSVASSANATLMGFSGPFDPSNWTTTLNTPGGGSNTASVDTSAAPASIKITGSDDAGCSMMFGCPQSDALIDYTTQVTMSGMWHFDFDYSTMDGLPGFDSAGYLLNGSYTDLTNSGSSSNMGQIWVPVSANDIIGWRVGAEDNCCGAPMLTISNFHYKVPEPGTLALFGIGLAGLGFARRRRLP